MNKKTSENLCKQCKGKGMVKTKGSWVLPCLRCNGTRVDPSQIKEEKRRFKFEVEKRDVFDAKKGFVISLKILHPLYPKDRNFSIRFLLDSNFLYADKGKVEEVVKKLNALIKIEEV